MEHQDRDYSAFTVVGSEPKQSAVPDDSVVPIVSYLGPVSSYTHQVFTLAQYDHPAWSIGLTDYDLAQTALQCFNADEYDYKPATTIPGYILYPTFFLFGI
jgi:hypothetical protein